MVSPTKQITESRVPLTRDRVFEAAVALADRHGIEELSMRKLGQELGVEAMSLYHHVANKGEILDGMVDAIVSEIPLTPDGGDWKSAMRNQILAARATMSRHPWAPGVIETRQNISTPIMKYLDSFGGMMRSGGFSVGLMHHAMHALGSRILGFSQELFDDKEAMEASPEAQALMLQQMTVEYPNISAIVEEIAHQEETVIGSGCDDDVEFVFSLDLLLDGLVRVRDAQAASG